MALKGLAGRVALLTGGASGIGLATAQRLIDESAKVAILDIDVDALDRARDVLPDGALMIRADVSREEDVVAAFEKASKHFGRIDALHNNAGIEGEPMPLVDTSVDQLDRLVAVNLRGIYLVLRQMLRTARRQDSGAAIVNTSSGTALHAVPGMAQYGATKAAVIALTRYAAVEGAAAGIRVNAVVPGPIGTELFRRLPDAVQEGVEDSVPAGRVGTPDEVAALNAWLLSDECPFVTGATYTIDGAETAA